MGVTERLWPSENGPVLPMAPDPPSTAARVQGPQGMGPIGPVDAPPTSDRLEGPPLRLSSFDAETITNRNFRIFDLAAWDRFFLPPTMEAMVDAPRRGTVEAVEDDNRSAIFPEPVATIDGLPYFLSVKGIGSTIDPFSLRRLDSAYAAELSDDLDVRERLRAAGPDPSGGFITGELWLRGSPYGGQGLPHAMTALRVSETADLTSIEGFRIAPVVKIALLPEAVANRLRSIHWYRRYLNRIVQEIRLVPSNVRIYFHGRSTVGQDPGHVFDRFRLDSLERAHRFEVNFVRSGIALLTLFARTLARSGSPERCSGLDFQDVWLDKDAVLAPDGTVFFVDLEGIDAVSVDRGEVREKIEDQIFRSLYEFMFAYEQIETERSRRFGPAGSRKRQFESIVVEALQDDPYVRARTDPHRLTLEIRPRVREESLSYEFPLMDF